MRSPLPWKNVTGTFQPPKFSVFCVVKQVPRWTLNQLIMTMMSLGLWDRNQIEAKQSEMPKKAVRFMKKSCAGMKIMIRPMHFSDFGRLVRPDLLQLPWWKTGFENKIRQATRALRCCWMWLRPMMMGKLHMSSRMAWPKLNSSFSNSDPPCWSPLLSGVITRFITNLMSWVTRGLGV